MFGFDSSTLVQFGEWLVGGVVAGFIIIISMRSQLRHISDEITLFRTTLERHEKDIAFLMGVDEGRREMRSKVVDEIGRQ